MLGALFCSQALGYDWLQWGGDARHSNVNAYETTISAQNVNQLQLKYSVPLGLYADSTPMFLEQVATPSGTKDLLFVVAYDGTLSALNAADGTVVWQHAEYNAAATGCVVTVQPTVSCYTNSSPAIDSNRQFVYAYAMDGKVHKYAVADGTETLTGGWPQVSTVKPGLEKETSPLAIAVTPSGTFLYASHATMWSDLGDYEGHVTAIDLSTGRQKVFNAACTEQQGVHIASCASQQAGIWGRAGVVYDSDTGRTYATTGNAPSGNDEVSGGDTWSCAVLALDPALSTLADTYTPVEYQSLDDSDEDLGSASVTVLPGGLGLQGGKDGKLRLLNLNDLSGQGGPGHLGGELQILDFGQNELMMAPAAWTAPDGTVYVYVMYPTLYALQLNPAVLGGSASLSQAWAISEGGSSPLIANGVLYFLDSQYLHAVDPLTGAELWNSNQAANGHWQHPIVANGVVYALSNGNTLTAFALSSGPPPPPPGNLLVNGSFEQPVQAPASFTYYSTIPGWTSVSFAVQSNGSPWGAPPAVDGMQTAALQGAGTISQTLNLGTGAYALTFSAAQRAYQCCGQPLSITLDGAQIGTAYPPDTSWHQYSLSFTVASTGTHTLAFTGTDPVGDKTTFIDAVTLTAVVQRSVATASISSSAPTSGFGSSVVFTVSVAGNAPSGSVAFAYDGSALCSAVSLVNGSAACATNILPLGTHGVLAVYSGDSNNLSCGAGLTQTVQQ